MEEAKEQKKEMCEVVAVVKLAVQSNKLRVVIEVKNVTSFLIANIFIYTL